MQARDQDEFGLDGEEGAGADGAEGAGADGEQKRGGSGLPWEGSDRDYTYEELLGMCAVVATSWLPRLGLRAPVIVGGIAGSCGNG